MTTQHLTVDRLRGFVWPAALVGGLLLVLLAQVEWGSTDEGVQPSITGLGRVTVPGASDEDVAFFFEDNTDRPGLSVILLGAVIAVVAALAWWRARLRPAAIGLIGLASVIALVVGIRTLSDPAAHLFSERVSQALDLDLPTMQPGYGLVGTVVVAVLLLVVVGFAVVTSVWSGGAAGVARVSRNDESS
ncbi:hypothetical protein IA539_11225 [Gordonia sp. zg691]|uniref:Uncharacterized protein n=1 Tax=Gordonia jinghuaiqii TaxID=2758710 RepID=A0A7D7LXQ2_9ACTN|nr:hypothetical protein [Gordonia jinghuaiqii]MBD0861778.1 hypothetical protein [Gordonia jinghuaiqii]MCR5977670.1 hypothetical protein [Gordonia jinghuaiqii]QMT02339.1 hypothetical protein H1R19_04030 [Gordonia jinghuaiqii]